MKLGSTISDIRKKKGIKQEELAKEVDITQAYLSLIENDHKEPNLNTLKRISDKLEVPLPILFFLSLEEKDLENDKKKLAEDLTPILKKLIKSLNS